MLRNLGILSALLLTALSSFAGETIVQCKIHLDDVGDYEVKIVKKENGVLQSTVIGEHEFTNNNVEVREFSIRKNMPYPLDPYSGDYGSYNFGEQALNAMYDQQNSQEFRKMLKGRGQLNLSFEITDVKMLKVYDLWEGRSSFTDKFGGTILMEAFDADNKLLGRAGRMMLSNGCF